MNSDIKQFSKWLSKVILKLPLRILSYVNDRKDAKFRLLKLQLYPKLLINISKCPIMVNHEIFAGSVNNNNK